jgi:uncharacterized protein YcbX
MATLRRIALFPIKSLDGVEVARARIVPSGGLEFDRHYALADEMGKFINGKRNPAVHGIRCRFDGDWSAVALEAPGRERATFRFREDRGALESWLSHYFGMAVRLLESPNGFPDDTEASGPTIVSEATTREVASWFPGLSAADIHRRFRANLELTGVPAFWEDRLFGKPGTLTEFTVGEVQFHGSNPCARCVVPTREPATAEAFPDFQKTFMRRRREMLPAWASVSQFDHYYRLCVNTRIPESQAGKFLNVGDKVRLADVRPVE